MAPSTLYSFGPFELDVRTRRFTRDGAHIALGDRQFGVLLHLLTNAGTVVAKEQIINAVWGDVAVTDNSLEQAVSVLRRLLSDDPSGQPYLETVPRRGYRFAGPLTRTVTRYSDDEIETLLAPHRAWIEGRAALETLERGRIAMARAAFESALATLPEQASAHVGLANACIMQFEATRADSEPDRAALATAVEHAREACRLDIEFAEAWATLGFVLDRNGQHTDALAASRRAVMLDPGNWRHHFRLALVSWGEERLGAARHTLLLVPGFPLAHYLAATVHVARQAIDEAERELVAGLASADRPRTGPVRFTPVALNWLAGLIALWRGDRERALKLFVHELASEASGQLYARECAANACYAIAALHWRDGEVEEARKACRMALDRIAVHPMASALLRHVDAEWRASHAEPTSTARSEAALGRACALALAGASRQAAELVDQLLTAAPPGGAGWLLPVEPILSTHIDAAEWQPVRARLRGRAS